MKFFSLFSSVFSILLLSASAHADTLQSWRFDARQNRLEFNTDEGVQPIAQLVPNPARLVVDLPGIRLGRPKANQTIGGAIQSLRVGQFNAQTTRLVIELAPGYTLDPQRVTIRGTSSTRWSVQLPTPQFSGTSAGIQTPQPIVIPTLAADTFGGLVEAGKQLAWLQQRITSVRSQYSSLKSGMYFLDMDNGNYLDLNGDKVFPAASVIKLPILIAFFQDVDAGKIKLNETLVMRRDLVASGSGDMQDMPIGSKFSALQTATKMITISDNTATNMIVDRMGGIAVLNQRFRSWGLQQTVIRNWLPDLKGTNTTHAKDLVRLLALLDKRKLLSSQSQAQAMNILYRTRTRTLLPAGLGRGATIAHKTGDIGFMVGDAGIIQMPNGKRYLAAVLVIRPYDDPDGRDFIREVSGIVYSYLTQSMPVATAPQK